MGGSAQLCAGEASRSGVRDLRHQHDGRSHSIHLVRPGMLPLALVLVLLIGSVLIPAQQSIRILQLLRPTADVVEPVREQGSRLQYGLVEESIELRAHMVAPDPQPHR